MTYIPNKLRQPNVLQLICANNWQKDEYQQKSQCLLRIQNNRNFLAISIFFALSVFLFTAYSYHYFQCNWINNLNWMYTFICTNTKTVQSVHGDRRRAKSKVKKKRRRKSAELFAKDLDVYDKCYGMLLKCMFGFQIMRLDRKVASNNWNF